MGNGYTRQSAADIVDTQTIYAVDLNDEFNALQSAFNSTLGHSHDGTSGEGPLISLGGSVTGTLPIANGGTGRSTLLTETTLTDAATITMDFATFRNAVVTLGGNRTLGAGANEASYIGQSGVIRVIQDATGGRTLAYNSEYEFASGTAPVLSTAANAEDLLFYYIIASGRIFLEIKKGIA